MARLFSPNFLILLSIILSSLLLPAFAAEGERPPELPDDPPPPPAKPDVNPNPAGNLEGSPAPFSESESGSEEDGIDLGDLADKIKELIESIISLFPVSSSTSSSTIALATGTAQTSITNTDTVALSFTSSPVTIGAPNATLACEIYQAYTSLCPPVNVSPTTITIEKPFTIDASDASIQAESDRASCLCYSSAYYVPLVFDDAVWACAAYTTDASDSASGAAATYAAAATAAAAAKEGFCSSIGNVRITPSYATFGEFTAAPATTSTPTTSAMGGGSTGGSTGAAGRLFGAERGAWACAAALAVVAALT